MSSNYGSSANTSTVYSQGMYVSFTNDNGYYRYGIITDVLNLAGGNVAYKVRGDDGYIGILKPGNIQGEVKQSR